MHAYLQDGGVPFIVDGQQRHFHGIVTVVCADNPASTCLGGFKESASAFRYCRHCTGTGQDIQSKVPIIPVHYNLKKISNIISVM
jgi:hypothetical protein